MMRSWLCGNDINVRSQVEESCFNLVFFITTMRRIVTGTLVEALVQQEYRASPVERVSKKLTQNIKVCRNKRVSMLEPAALI